MRAVPCVVAALALIVGAAVRPGTPGPEAGARAHPRMLVAETDPFSGLPALRAKYAAGLRPPDDLAGWALSYLLTGDEAFARRALEELRRFEPPRAGGSNQYFAYVTCSLAFDWLYDAPGFDTALKHRIANVLLAAAERMLALPSLADPSQAAYHNHTARELALATFALTAIHDHPPVAATAAPLLDKARRSFDNLLATSDLVTPGGGYHESMDYMRITFAPMAMMAELQRSSTGEDPARRFGVFANMGTTYLYKVLPDGSTARDDDNEFPHLDRVDNVVLGYAVHRFKDPFAAWILRESGWLPKEWRLPVLEFLWSDGSVVPRDPASTRTSELPRQRLFAGVGHLVMRSGWDPGATWIQFTSGPYFAKHDHLDTNQFVVYRKGYLAVDTGADYTDTESPHYLNYYRRTVAHNTVLVFQPGETFFWGENLWPAANDGGQRMDSSRFWNSVRSLDDWERTRDLWDRGRIEAYEAADGEFVYARGNGTASYHPSKVERFVRELLWLPGADVLFVADAVRAGDPAYRKAWLLHGVGEPRVETAAANRQGAPAGTAPAKPAGRPVGHGGTAWRDVAVVEFEDGGGRLRVHPVLPADREVTVRGGPGWEFWTPGDERGGDWGSGANWPLDPPDGGPLPADITLNRMWRTFWGEGFDRLQPSNRRAVVPGAWRLEVSPATAQRDDRFLSVLEIGDRGAPALRIEPVRGHRVAGAVVEGHGGVLFCDAALPNAEAEVTLPPLPIPMLLVAGLESDHTYELQFTSNFAPGSPVARVTVRASAAGLARVKTGDLANTRMRMRRVTTEGAMTGGPRVRHRSRERRP